MDLVQSARQLGVISIVASITRGIISHMKTNWFLAAAAVLWGVAATALGQSANLHRFSAIDLRRGGGQRGQRLCGGWMQFTDMTATNFPKRFYRVAAP